jgi:hypothetical protein
VVLVPPEGAGLPIVTVRLSSAADHETVATGGPDCVRGRAALAPGDYELFASGFGDPVTAALHFIGLTGSSTVTTRRRVSWHAAMWQPNQPIAAPLFSAGSHNFLAGGGIGWAAAWTSTVVAPVSTLGVCIYPPGSSSPAGFGPGCPGATWTTTGLGNGGTVVSATGSPGQTGSVGLGGYVGDVGVQSGAGVAAFWLNP